MKKGMKFTQKDIDQLIHLQKPSKQSKEMDLQKGLQRQTLDKIRNSLSNHENEYLTSEQIASETELSKVTVRRYMNYLIEQNEITSVVDYSTGGRPSILYKKTTD